MQVVGKHLAVEPQREGLDCLLESGRHLREARKDLETALHGKLDLLGCLRALLHQVDELDPQEQESELLINTVLSDLF